MVTPFRPEPFTDFTNEQQQLEYKQALLHVQQQLGKDYELIIDGERIRTENKIVSINPANTDQVIGVVAKADVALAEKAIQTAAKTFESWKSVAPEQRARYLFKAAAILRRRKHEFSAWLTVEAGKSWPEADADTAEAIDFMEYYARQMLRLAERQPLTRLAGEDNELYYIPLGVGIVIPPWNFPLAIMVGMTTAALVAGNTVVLKPASATPIIAAKFMEVLEEAGVPAGVVNYLPGQGSEIGDYLVDHPLTRFISFTGSREVGLRIHERAAKVQSGQKWMKRFIAEMGGKDAIVVDKEADLELAAQGIVTSAFGFSGQKCSACSRAIIHQDVYDQVLDRVTALTEQLTVGDPQDPTFYTGPVIDQQAYQKTLDYIEIGKKEGVLVTGGKRGDGPGYFIQPTVFSDVHPKARIMQEEIFGPVVAFTKARDFDHALEIANQTEYGLTGSVYSTNRVHLEKARESFHTGNLYFNRKCTGAIVGVHPFGGFNMSGTNSKAGGPDYLSLFTQAKLVSERL
ncbi:L-glutamate gamma-semialdehyde dehydrogenase [Ammoniphilus oxalaticus]|uniref:L-glutamate gamma-semialdehyde dehydrogenase n=1 Tax=Ammoniphilus oxalaticus TaxID=66863 RepID=A0A419SDA5_9BACL|nr:L-glutamate gamma-semialdehyde dehydrogenase [Ammoniphilus oxalaticus]RKD21075.1 L-glutamate gamma-semialdehyde dehydrogenase [Ammoniphilus oxalaticus]